MPGIIKIGYTTKTINQRTTELCSSAGVPGSFDVFTCWEVFDPQKVEHKVHSALNAFRISPDKEFFEIRPSVAKEHIEKMMASDTLLGNNPLAKTIVSDAKSLGTFIRERRKQNGMTQRDLSKIAGTGLRFIIDVEKGKTTSQIGKILGLIESLGANFSITVPTIGIPTT